MKKLGETTQQVSDETISEIDDLISSQNIPIHTDERNDQDAVVKESRALKNLRPHNAPGLKENEILSCSEADFLAETNGYKEKLKHAKTRELQNLVKNEVFEEIPFEGQDAVSSRWVITMKKNEKGEEIIKARLVARGFEEPTIKNIDSPTCSRESLRLVFCVAASTNWKLGSLDISSAFLQGNKLDRTVYLKTTKRYLSIKYDMASETLPLWFGRCTKTLVR